jgi:hypothetical protein
VQAALASSLWGEVLPDSKDTQFMLRGAMRMLPFALLGVLGSSSAFALGRSCMSEAAALAPAGTSNTNAGGGEFRQGPNFVVLENADALASAACVSQKVAHTVLFDAVERMRLSTGLDPQIVVVLATAPLACGDLFYLPFSNDVQGIGYQHQDGRELFDDSPDSRLEGIAFLNDFPYWQTYPEEFAKDFNHEIAHRWAARVYVTRDGATSPILLGRQLQHWSYYLDTGGSPIEGNAWSSTDGQHLRADTPTSLRPFSDLDLYLMGILPAAEVRPERLVVSSDAAFDCLGHAISASSPPQTCGALAIAGRAESIGIDAVLDAEGERVPAPDPSARVVDVAVLVLESKAADLDQAMCEALTSNLRERLDDFQSSTLGRIVLHNLSESSTTCTELCAAMPTPFGPDAESSGCDFASRATRIDWTVISGFLLLAMLMRRADSSATN